MQIECFTCDCISPEHTLQFTYFPPDKKLDEESEIFTSVFLTDYPYFWGRLYRAIKYVFGYKCKYGHFDCFTLRREEAGRLVSLLNKYIEDDKPDEKIGRPLNCC